VRGDANRESDWDFLVVVPEPSSASTDPLVPWRLRSDTGVRADVVVYAAADFEAERAVPNTLAYEAASAGVALYPAFAPRLGVITLDWTLIATRSASPKSIN
jgi:predicted nucleotidyltransferase